MNVPVCKPELLSAIHTALEQLTQKKEKFAVALDAWPTKVFILPGDDVLIWKGADEKYLAALGLRQTSEA